MEIPKFLGRVVTAKYLADCRAKQAAYQQRRALYTSQFRGDAPPSDPATRPRRGRIEDTRQTRLLFSPAARE